MHLKNWKKLIKWIIYLQGLTLKDTADPNLCTISKNSRLYQFCFKRASSSVPCFFNENMYEYSVLWNIFRHTLQTLNREVKFSINSTLKITLLFRDSVSRSPYLQNKSLSVVGNLQSVNGVSLVLSRHETLNVRKILASLAQNSSLVCSENTLNPKKV